MDAINRDERMKKVTELLKSLYKQYHYSPKAWRELKALSGALQQKIWKLTNLGGTRWLPHVARALQTLMNDYAVVVAHMENTIESRSASADMIGRAKQCVQMLKDYSCLLFVVLVQDILKVLSCLSLKLQEDGITLPKALQAFETALLMLTSLHSTAGESLEGFLQGPAEGQFHAVQLQSFSQESRDRFDRLKSQLLDAVIKSMRSCFNDLENDKILQAVARLVDPREWPTEEADLASYGAGQRARRV
ncbi:hypothetical protein AAFF_G00286270 [Aldrovandia affinis]|uniref:Uncharacterized protein n=1 Tax=Aldrovandia affinis TaxID=143900 RepID=A0AAD7TAK7_9TELE|nr:hypothetical protein AAFF_G00286270 [Aldrovandia affinis]